MFLQAANSASGSWSINEIWQHYLSPQLERIAEPLFALVVRRLRERHELLRVWGGATREFDSDIFRLGTVAPPKQRFTPRWLS